MGKGQEMKPTPKPTVTVAVSAFNEEKNIEAFLESVISQKEEGFKLEKILVISDGSIDATVERARSFGFSRLEVIAGRKRLGQSTRLRQIYARLKSDILVQTDADVILAHPLVIRDLVFPLISNTSVGMCCGNPRPMAGKTFIEKADKNVHEVMSSLYKSLRNGQNPFIVHGCIMALRKELVEKIEIPQDVVANDIFVYYFCLNVGYRCTYVPSAQVYFRLPQTFQDKVRQNLRSAAAGPVIAKYFPASLVARESQIPLLLNLRSKFHQLLKDPIGCTFIYLINKYSGLRVRILGYRASVIWPVAASTKELGGIPT